MKKLAILLFFLSTCMCDTVEQESAISLCLRDTPVSCQCLEYTSEVNGAYAIDAMCSFKNFTSLSSDMLIPQYTEKLDFSVNEIKQISKYNILTSPSLIKLSFNRNKIQSIEANSFVGLPKLEQLDLSENLISELPTGVFHGIFKLKMLNLAFNKLKSFVPHTFRPLPQLELLSLDNNNLGDFFQNTTDIFSNSGIGVNPKIMFMFLKNANISILPEKFFDKAYNLRELSIAENPIDYFPQFPFTVEVLDLSCTRISTITAKEMATIPGVKKLMLNDLENLKEIGEFTFQPLKALKQLEIKNCKKLRNFSPWAFGANILNEELFYEFTVTDISFLSSGLTSLDEKLLPLFSQLTTLDLRANPWVCDCKLDWFLRLQIKDDHKEFIRCWGGAEPVGRQLWSMKPREFRCKTWRSTLRSLTTAALVVLCLLLAGLAVWLVALWRPPPPPPPPQSTLPYSRISIQPNRAEAY